VRFLNPNVDPADVALLIARLAETDPDHELVVAARLALEVAYARASRPFNIEDFAGGRYHRANEIAEYDSILKRRYPPNGDRDEWVQYGDAGRPAHAAQSQGQGWADLPTPGAALRRVA